MARLLPRLLVLAAFLSAPLHPALASPGRADDATPEASATAPLPEQTATAETIGTPEAIAPPPDGTTPSPEAPEPSPVLELPATQTPEVSASLEPSATLEQLSGGASLDAADAGVVPAVPTGCSLSTTTFTNVATIPLLDPGVITGTVNVSGMGPFIWDVNLIANITHSNAEDLDIRLISPNGSVSTMTTDNGLQFDNVFNGTTWDDQAAFPVTDFSFTTNSPVTTLVPEEALGAFVGEGANGLWQLQVSDDTDNGTGGQLAGWSLQITTLAVRAQGLGDVTADETDFAIPDNGSLLRTLNVSGAGATLGELFLVTDIAHTRNDNLDVFLVSPGGVTVTVTTDNGGSFASGYVSMDWYDQAGVGLANGAVTDATFQNGASVSPMVTEGALSAFNGTNPNGTWKLLVVDDAATNTGTLRGWSLDVRGFDCRPDVSVAASSVPSLAGSGGPLTYTLDIANLGGHPAQNVSLQFEVLSGGTLAMVPSFSGWQCGVPVGNNTKFQCTQATLHNGFINTFPIRVNTFGQPQSVMAVVTATTTSIEPTTANNTESFFTYAGLFSANGNPWDVNDDKYGQDTGAIGDGGQDAFDTYGGLRLRVRDESFALLVSNVEVNNYNLTYFGNRHWVNTAAPVHGGVALSRQIWAPANANWVRYVDVFANTTNSLRVVEVVWGGGLGSDDLTTVAATSTGDATFNENDAWVVTMQSAELDPSLYADDPPVGAVLASSEVGVYTGPYTWGTNAFTTPWAGNGNDSLGHRYLYVIPANSKVAMATFLYRGLAENRPGPQNCTTNCVTPGLATQVALAQSVLISLEANPPLCNLSPSILAAIANWTEADKDCKFVYVPITQR